MVTDGELYSIMYLVVENEMNESINVGVGVRCNENEKEMRNGELNRGLGCANERMSDGRK